jgi:8-amino-7-oxononanoate synthase
MGITTYDFKQALGALAHPCRYYIKACKQGAFTPLYAELFREVIELPTTSHSPFGQEPGQEDLPAEAGPAPAGEAPDADTTGADQNRSSLDPLGHHSMSTRPGRARLAGIYAYFPVFEGPQGPVVRHQGRDVIMLGSNSYLGLSQHPRLVRAMHEALDHYGSGCSGSPLLNGTLTLHRDLAIRLAGFCQKQDALLYSTGYQTNVGTLSALIGRRHTVLMDRRSHASLIDGVRLSGARLIRYNHNDMASLEQALQSHRKEPCLIVTDSVFSMEGTVVQLPELVRLARRYGARIMLDESHALGVLGPHGRGAAELFGLSHEIDVIMGTFSKSFASVGGFVAGDRTVIDSVRHNSRGLIFSASLPPSAVAAVLAALDLVEEEPWRRQALMNNADQLRTGLRKLGYRVDSSEAPILPVHCGHELIALGAYARLLELGVFVNPVLSPAVPQGEEVLRLSLLVSHERTHLENALRAFELLKAPRWPLHTA